MALGLVRRLPAPLRLEITRLADLLRALLDERASDEWYDVEHSTLAPRRPSRSFVGRRVAIAGLFGFRCGLQRGAELMVLDYKARGFEVFSMDVTALLKLAPNIPTDASSDLQELIAWEPTDLVVHINPPSFARVLAAFPRALLARVAVVAYWAWELPVLPRLWEVCSAFADEIWVPSAFVSDAVLNSLPDYAGAVRVVPHAVDRDPMQAAPRARRSALRVGAGLAAESFTVGYSFSFDSNYTRKNPCGAIDAFRLAFDPADDVQLLIRCSDCANHRRLYEHLLTYSGDDARILVVDTAASPLSIRSFYSMLDVYVSLHRSEGYGLGMAEAAQTGLPVLATGWGLATDIAARPQIRTIGFRLVLPIDPQGVYDFDPCARWAEPDLPQAASVMRELHAAWKDGRAEN